eukprot:PhM_4_TR14739/c0_g1_i2/m.98548
MLRMSHRRWLLCAQNTTTTTTNKNNNNVAFFSEWGSLLQSVHRRSGDPATHRSSAAALILSTSPRTVLQTTDDVAKFLKGAPYLLLRAPSSSSPNVSAKAWIELCSEVLFSSGDDAFLI